MTNRTEKPQTDQEPHLAQPRGTTDNNIPERRLYRIPDAMRLLSLSRSVLYEQIRAGRLRSVVQGRSRLIPATAITDYVTLLLREAGHEHDQPA